MQQNLTCLLLYVQYITAVVQRLVMAVTRKKEVNTVENQPLFPPGCFVIAFHDGKAHEESLEKICDVWETGNSIMDVLRIYPSANYSPPLSIYVVHLSLFLYHILSCFFLLRNTLSLLCNHDLCLSVTLSPSIVLSVPPLSFRFSSSISFTSLLLCWSTWLVITLI